MKRNLHALAAAGVFAGVVWVGGSALAQKTGGILKVYFFDSPASMSIHEEATIAAQGPMMGVFNNLVMYKQDVPQSGFQSIVPDLATDWSTLLSPLEPATGPSGEYPAASKTTALPRWSSPSPPHSWPT